MKLFLLIFIMLTAGCAHSAINCKTDSQIYLVHPPRDMNYTAALSYANGTSIPAKYWGKTIERLNPSRVYLAGSSIFVVRAETETSEVGNYFFGTYQSQLPSNTIEGDTTFSWEVCNKLVRYEKQK